MNKHDHLFSITIIIIGIAALIILGTSLNQLQLDPGLPFEDLWAFLVSEFYGGFAGGYATSSADVGIGNAIVEIVRTVYFIALFCFPLALFIVLSSKESRKRLLRAVFLLIVLTIVLSRYVMNNQIVEPDTEELIEAFIPEKPSDTPFESSIKDEFTPSIPRWIIWTLSGILVTLALMIGLMVYRIIHPAQVNLEPLPELAGQAKSAIDAMQNGADFRNTILQCYTQMLRIVREQRGIQRNSAVTATEFISSLVKLGLPEMAVGQLTKLFEEVRYGSITHTNEEEQSAISNLQSIADAFKVTS